MNNLFFTQASFLILLIIPLIMWLHSKNKSPNQKLKQFADPHLWQWIIRNPNAGQHDFRSTLFIIAITLAILAAAGPAYFDKNKNSNQYSGNDIVFVADISNSMSVTDVIPNRLQHAKFELNALLQKQSGNRIGLVVFSSQAYSVLPLTHDIKTVQTFIAALDTKLSRYRGSRLSNALNKAALMLEQSKADSRAIILITDGDIHDAEQSINIAQQLGAQQLPIFILSSGTRYGGPVLGRDGKFITQQGSVVTSRLNTDLITTLANSSHGMATFGDNMESEALQKAIQNLAKANYYSTTNAVPPQALYPWLLITSLLLFFYLGMQRFNAMLLSCLLIPGLLLNKEVNAADLWHYFPLQEQHAYQAFQKGDFDTAVKNYSMINGFNQQMGAGAAAYRNKQWLQAEKYFRKAFLLAKSPNNKAKAIYNVGNTLLQSHQHDTAKSAYQQATMLDPLFKNAIINLKLLNTVMALSSPPEHEKPTQQTAIMKHPDIDDQTQFSNTISGQQPQNIDNITAQHSKQKKINGTLKKWYPENKNIDSQLLAAQHQSQVIQTTQTAILQQRINSADQRNTPTREEKPW